MLKSFKEKISSRTWWKRLFKRAAVSLFWCVFILYFIREVGVQFNEFPCELIENPPSAKLVLDKEGNVIWAETNKDQNWQIPVSLEEMSPWVVKATLSVEDSRFFSHTGVDDIAVARAGIKAVLNRRLTSGASTLTMQLVKMAHLKGRSLSYKFTQMCEAISLERQRSKKWILERYLNYAPYGGNIIGIEAAARFYFRKRAKDLNLYEASLLAGLPKAPSTLRPDRHPKRAFTRQAHVLQRMLTEGEIEQIPKFTFYKSPEKRPGDSRLGLAQQEEHIANMFKKSGEITSTIDPALNKRLNQLTNTHLERLNGVDCAAVVLIDNKSSEVLALVSYGAEKVNSALSPRSSGSVLKPFIYLNLVNNGSLTAVSKLDDRKLNYKDYDVRNFSGHFSGRVSLQKALTSSLNSPAVRALQEIGVDEFLKDLRNMGLTTLTRNPDEYGLSLALGGAEVNLLELTNAYSCLARNGLFKAWILEKGSSKEVQLYNEGAVEALTKMLRSEALGPGTLGRLSWKTGTSNGFRDAWCIAYNDEITVGTWLGNEDGSSNRQLIGSVAAAPLVLKIFNELYPNGLPLPNKNSHLKSFEVCSQSGLRPTSNCKSVLSTDISNSITLSNCKRCQHKQDTDIQKTSKLNILSPVAGRYKSIDKVRLELKSNQTASWFINGRFIGKGNTWYDFPKGDHRISCINTDGTKLTVITVE